jgi:hypothetical protein
LLDRAVIQVAIVELVAGSVALRVGHTPEIVPVENCIVENTRRVLDVRYVDADLEAFMYPAAQPEVCEIGFAVEPYRLCVCVLDFGVVDDRERESIVRLPALDEFRVLKRGQAVDVQEGMRVSERKCVHAASPARYTDQHKRQSYN